MHVINPGKFIIFDHLLILLLWFAFYSHDFVNVEDELFLLLGAVYLVINDIIATVRLVHPPRNPKVRVRFLQIFYRIYCELLFVCNLCNLIKLRRNLCNLFRSRLVYKKLNRT